jgi:hypothetical protein
MTALRNYDNSLGYVTQRYETSRAISTSKGNSAERIRNHSYLKNEQIILQLKKAQDLLKKSQQALKNKTPPPKS